MGGSCVTADRTILSKCTSYVLASRPVTEPVLTVVANGLQLLGLNDNVYWAIFIANLIFGVAMSHAGVMISAILRLTNAEWRRPITRTAEILAIFSLLTAAIFPIIHTGRLWRTAYWVFPCDFNRGVWPTGRR